ncbi:peptidase S8/S53 domain-containing protein [Lactarius pseudohatsudake]|nr:peptidase S8/S53 domain-containing protein [Lactarius pseudohatsudake]
MECPTDSKHGLQHARVHSSTGLCKTCVRSVRAARRSWRQRPPLERQRWSWSWELPGPRQLRQLAGPVPPHLPLHLCISYFNPTFEQQTSVGKPLTTLSTVIAGPWVTSVGGTTGYNPEIAASLSGGGFSAYFPQPPYQNNAVPAFFLNLGGLYNGLYNPRGRGVPDIAVQAMDSPVVFKNVIWEVSGTSCSTPTAARIISLLNDYRISNGRSPLGFLNVLLYGICLGGLNEITFGIESGLQYRWVLRCAWVGSCEPSHRHVFLFDVVSLSIGHGSRVTRL